jgi:peptide/nickel transport system ATP-binding protein
MLKIENLKVDFRSNGSDGMVRAVNGASLHLAQGETLAVIGESGSGKSVMGLSICGLLPSTTQISGRIFFENQSLLDLPLKRLRAMRGRKIAFVPQSAGLSLNPTMVSGKQVAEVFTKRLHQCRRKAVESTRALFTHLGLETRVYHFHPHRLSGGMRQRVLISMGLAGKPDLLIADEPTKGIDHSRRRQVTNLFVNLRKANPNTAILLITHDIHLAESIADQVAVMYGGQIMEQTQCETFFQKPFHPYSRALLNALPERGLMPLPGAPPRPSSKLKGCAFHPRCSEVKAVCKNESPPQDKITNSIIRCWRYAHA